MDESEEKKVVFQGELAVSDGVARQCAVTIQYQQWNPEILTVNLLWLGQEQERSEGAMALQHLGRNHVWLESMDGYHLPAEILGIRGVSTQHTGSNVHSSSVDASAVQIGITKSSYQKETKLNVIVRLQPSGILVLPSIKTQSFTGTVEIEQIETGSVEFNVPGGMLEARETTEYSRRQVHGDKITEQIQRASMLGEITLKIDENLWDLHEEIKKALNTSCSALSLCFRQTVDYYEIEYINLDESIPKPPSKYRRRWLNCKSNRKGDELINTRALVDGGLQRLITSIECSEREDDIHRAIQFLASSYQAAAETAYFMAFSAMETIVSCCLDGAEEKVLGSSAWKKVESFLRKTIEENLEPTVQEQLVPNLPGLKRVTLSSRIEKACEKYLPKIDDLWPALTFEKGMERAIKIRNGLFHAADAYTEESLVGDLSRIQVFSERLLLKRLGWNDEDIWVWYDQNLKWINSNDR